MRRAYLKLIQLIFLSFVGWASIAVAAEPEWETVAPGLSYKKLNHSVTFSKGAIHAFQIDPKEYDFEVALTGENDTETETLSIPKLMKQRNAAIAVNGGFFTPDMELLGLRISQGTELSPIRSTSWWGIFYIKNDKAFISSRKNYHPSSKIDFAVQAGPRLVVNGNVPSLKPGVAKRTALGIQPSGNVILLVTQNLLLSTEELAEIMRRPETEKGFNCTQALNLDGGGSTQLYTQLDDLSLRLKGLSRVTDTVLIVSKERSIHD